jgi:hypothetical protein
VKDYQTQYQRSQQILSSKRLEHHMPRIFRFLPRTALVLLASAALTLTACVESGAPIVRNAKPLLGQQFNVHLYDDFTDGKPKNFHAAAYRWTDGEYIRASGLGSDAKRFTAEPLAGSDFVIQSTDEHGKRFVFWIGRKLHDGAYLIFPLNVADADDATRKSVCGAEHVEVCRISTHEQLVVMARATAAKPPRDQVLSVVLAK